MVIEGFTPEYASQYITRYFIARSAPEQGNNLNEEIKTNSFVGSLIHVPLFCTMVCHLYEVGALSNAHSMTSLFENINQFLLQHALAKEVSLFPQGEELEDVIHGIGEFAFDGLQNDSKQLVFKEEDFRYRREAYEIGINLGILSTIKIPVKHIDRKQTSKTTVEFFHKLEQEYCASVFLGKLSKKRSTGLFKSRTSSHLKDVLKRDVSTVAKTLELENVLCFVAGSSGPACLAVLKHIARQVKEFVLYYKCRLVLHCMVEADPNYINTCEGVRYLRKCFWDGMIDLHPLTDRIMTGIEKLPQGAKSKVIFCIWNFECWPIHPAY